MTSSHLRLAALWRGQTPFFVALVALRLVVGVTWIVQAIATARLFALLVGAGSAGDPLALLEPTVVLTSAVLARPLVVLAAHVLAQRAMTSVKRDLRARALGTLIRRAGRDPRGRSGSDHALVVDGVENLDPYLSGYLPQLVVTAVTVTAVTAGMIALDPVAGLAAGLAAASVPFLPRLWSRLLTRRGGDQWTAYENLHAEFVDSMQGMTTLVAFGADGWQERRLAAASQSLLARTVSQLRLSLLDSGLAALALVGAPALVLLVLAARPGPPDPIIAFTLVLLAIEMVRPLRDLAGLWHAGYVGTFSGTALLTLLSEPEPRGAAGTSEAPDAVAVLGVRDLLVRHPDAVSPALEVDSLDLEAGLTAIIGPSGAGKSTLATVLAGLLVPTAGTVALDGQILDPDRLLGAIALVPQDPALLGGTVAEEVARGARPGAHDVSAALRIVGVETDDPRLRADTPVGEGGALLSGGQRQRTAIARGLAQNRSVLVLDEATSALDPAGEAAVLTRVRAAHSGILVAVTHRREIARVADRVVVVEAGRIVADGPPHQVLDERVDA